RSARAVEFVSGDRRRDVRVHHKRSICIGLGVCAGIGGWALATGAAASSQASEKVAANVVKVRAGKPSELHFSLSKVSNLPAGTITFKVTNAGAALHDFKVCTSPAPGADAALRNSCTGKATRILKPRQTATLTM